MLRATIQKNHDIDITDPEIKSFLKTSSFAYLPRKCVAFRPDEIKRFLSEAADNEFLAFKVSIASNKHKHKLTNIVTNA